MTDPKQKIVATAAAALLVLSPAASVAQEAGADDGAQQAQQQEQEQAGGAGPDTQSLRELAQEADQPDIAETDPVNETEMNEIGGRNDEIADGLGRGPAMGMGMGMADFPMLDLQGFAGQIYERGFRQGYIQGVADARERMILEMQEQRQEAQNRRMRMQSDEQQAPGTGRGQRGTIVVLPPGMSPEAFIERLMQDNERAMRGGMQDEDAATQDGN